ncbi:hypothetical protein [Brevibacterium luteolum]|uniref:hypothetical protein n=1 Tax=Brevibacterium luteolum TaxID=199591 RepID=UPI001C235849|nr:hypothetical protein [Brevibacterium luteolum]MBU8579082.1 hypothetical protein [Brevibacterium luteolum]
MSDDTNEQPTSQDQNLADEISAHYHPIAMTLFGLLEAEDQIDQPESQAVDAAQIAEVSVVAAALRIWHWVASGPNAQRPAAETGELSGDQLTTVAELAGLEEAGDARTLAELPLTERAWATLLLTGMLEQAGSESVTVGLPELFGPVAEAVAAGRAIELSDEQAGALARWLSVWALAAANHWQQVNTQVTGAGDLDIPLFSTLAMYLGAGGRVSLPESEQIHAVLETDERLKAHTAEFFRLLGYAPETISGESFAHVVLAGTSETLLRILGDWRSGGVLIDAGDDMLRAHPGARLSLITLVSIIQGTGQPAED